MLARATAVGRRSSADARTVGAGRALQARRPIGNQAALQRLPTRAARPASAPIHLQRQPAGKTDKAESEDCPKPEPGELQASAKAKLQMVERIPQQEWLIYGFPIGGGDMAPADAGNFIAEIVRSLSRGSMIYVTGQQPLEVIGYTDCLSGPGVDNHQIRKHRADSFCAGARAHYASSPASAAKLIQSCDAAPADQSIGANATAGDRAHNRSVLVRRIPTAVTVKDGKKSFPFNPKYGPSDAHCSAYQTPLAREILGPTYTKNAHCSCMVTPDEPHNNCVRDCLQDKMWTYLTNAKSGQQRGRPAADKDMACAEIWRHHRECYHNCGCAAEFIDFLAFDGVCNVELPCAVDSAAINVLNRCMPATDHDKYMKVDKGE